MRTFGVERTARAARIAAVAFVLALAVGALLSSNASAQTSRPLLKTLKFPDGTEPQEVATDKAGNIYAAVAGSPQRIEKFDPEGNPVNFTASKPYVSGNEITESGDAWPLELGEGGIAVDQTSGPTEGYIYVTATLTENYGGAVYIYKPSGEWAGKIDQGDFFAFRFSCSVALNPSTGAAYTGYFYTGYVRRFAATTEPEGTVSNGQASTAEQANCALAVDPGGNFYSVGGEVPNGPIIKYPADSFTATPSPREQIYAGPATGLNYDAASGHLFADRGADLVELTLAGAEVNAPFGGLSRSRSVTAAPGNRVYAQSNGSNETAGSGSIAIFGPPAALPKVTTEETAPLQTSAILKGTVDPDGAGAITKCEFQWGKDARYLETPIPCSEATPINSATAVSAELTGLQSVRTYHYRLVTTSANGVQTGHDFSFKTPDNVAEVATGGPDPFNKECATLHASYRGQGLDTKYFFEIGADTSYGRKVPVPPADDGVQSGPREVAPLKVCGLQGETEYHYRVVMENSLGASVGADRTFVTPVAVDSLETGGAINVGNESAELTGSFTADALEVHYFFEWGPTTSYGNKTPALPGNAVPPGSGHVDVPPVLLENLQEGGIYHYRIVATNSAGISRGGDKTFKTAEGPEISNLASKNVKATSADLTGEINPNRGVTEWFFEWGPTTNYGNKTPVPPGSVPAGSDPVPVQVHLENLTVGQTYHFRLVASNQFGSRESGDQAFGFYPPECPNSLLRQETNASHLPDCRAYELVSPGNANGATIEPFNAPSSGLATNPPRLLYGASYGELPGAGEALISVGDMYVATRESNGWVSKYVGKNARETSFMAGPPHGQTYGTTGYGGNNSYFGSVADPSLSRVAMFDLGYPAFSETIEPASNTAWVFNTTTNSQVGHWPTNVGEVAKGESFVGWQAFSEDLSHFVFSSNIAFAPGGEEFAASIKCCSFDEHEFEAGRCCPGPIYDNDTETGEVDLISEREDHSHFQGVPVKVSSDGSHILMSETADSLVRIPRPLYMRVGGQTYDIANRAPADYVEMTANGSTVYFTSTEQLTADDHDHSVDLFVWNDSEPHAVTRVSKGISGNEGDRDNCELTWVENCDIQYIDFNNTTYAGASNGNVTGNETSDSSVASATGDIYFVSPEQLDGARGSFGQANIYLYHEGNVRFVASAEPESCIGRKPTYFDPAHCNAGKISRMQVTPNGDFAAFISKSRLTPYNNNGKAELYLYSRFDDRLDCASCRPDGQQPNNDAWGSQNGLFLSEDGRAFFSTDEPLLPSDTNEGNDVYEFVEGKPQLITTGTGEKNVYQGFQGELTAPGLVGVSASGGDVYFATLESLVTQDHNGQAVKIYDARSNGGFPADRVKPECEAADECHVEGSAPPVLPQDRTSVQLEGNPKQAGKKAKKHKKAKKAHKKKHRKVKHGGRGGRHAG